MEGDGLAALGNGKLKLFDFVILNTPYAGFDLVGNGDVISVSAQARARQSVSVF